MSDSPFFSSNSCNSSESSEYNESIESRESSESSKASASVGRLSIYFLSRHTAKSCLFNYLTFQSNSYQYSVKKLLKQTTLLFGAAHFVFKVLLDVLVHMVLFIISTRCRPGQIIIN